MSGMVVLRSLSVFSSRLCCLDLIGFDLIFMSLRHKTASASKPGSKQDEERTAFCSALIDIRAMPPIRCPFAHCQGAQPKS